MHILPGRVRLRIQALKNNQQLARELAAFLKAAGGINHVQINTLTGSCLIFFEQTISPEKIIQQVTRYLSQNSAQPVTNHARKQAAASADRPVRLQQVIGSGAILTLFWGLPGQQSRLGSLALPVSSAAVISAGLPVFKSGFSYFSKHKRPNYEFLVSCLSLFTALAGKGYLGLLTLWLASVSDYLQNLVFKVASRRFSSLLIKRGNKISLLKEGKIRPVLPGDVMPGDLGVFAAGDCIPVEGEVVAGRAVMIAGEFLLPGSPVEAGSVLTAGRVVVKVHRLVEDTSLARLADILEDAMEDPQLGTGLAVSYTEKLLPFTFLSTALVFILTRDWQRTIPVLLSGAPGPAGLAAPTAYAASTGVAAGLGIALQDTTVLEKLSETKVVIFNDKGLSHRQGELHPALQLLVEEGYYIEDFDPAHLHEQAATPPAIVSDSLSPHSLVEKIHRQGLKVAWVSGPEHPLLVANADVNIMFLKGKERFLSKAQVLCYKNDPRQVYRLLHLSRHTMHTVRQNVYLVQCMNLLGQVLGALGVIKAVPAVGLTLLTTLAVVYNSGASLFGIGWKNNSSDKSGGTIQGLTVDQGKCLLHTRK
ncbi:HMA2 domain-containing protein [Desulforamulus hydrothermalis]|nr:cation-transporting P-type ATPase [Desulforamulus hydrothermalis]